MYDAVTIKSTKKIPITKRIFNQKPQFKRMNITIKQTYLKSHGGYINKFGFFEEKKNKSTQNLLWKNHFELVPAFYEKDIQN